MERRQKVIMVIIGLALMGIIGYFIFGSKELRKPITLNNKNQSPTAVSTEPANTGNVSPISGLPCENWNRRPIAVMQPADPAARPAAGFSEADMVIEMPAATASNTRLMGIYLCDFPAEAAAIRSARHDNIHIAKGLDAIFVHWGYSLFAENLINKKVIDNVNCLASPYCDRNQTLLNAGARKEDTGRITRENALKMLNESGYRKEGNFQGYPHQADIPVENRIKGGHLRVAFAGVYAAEYDYDRESNSYFRTWGNVPDTDRNNKKRLAPKNVIVMFAASDQITNTQDYVGKGLNNPWEGVPEIKNSGVESISGRYNNIQLGDPWYDQTDSGEAFYYMNGVQTRGTWKKDKSDIASKLSFFTESGSEVAFVPGQMWVEVLEPGQTLKWEPVE